MPINIYLGRIAMAELPILFLKQAVWILILWLISRFIWSKATKKIIVNGG
jgi:ABC-2 type transport system permease protein